jgi:hypothetical protein
MTSALQGQQERENGIFAHLIINALQDAACAATLALQAAAIKHTQCAQIVELNFLKLALLNDLWHCMPTS